MYCDAIGHDLPAETQQRYTGVKWIYLRQDLRSAFFYWKRGELSFREWISSLRGRKFFAVLSWRDPIPFLADLWRAMRKEFRKRLRQRAGDVTSRDARHETSLEHNRQVQPRDQN
jgi:predicted ATP-grasp superfamily ATP-dependent carboligase